MFSPGRYFSDDHYEMVVLARRERTRTTGARNPRIYAYEGFAMPAYYRIRYTPTGREYVVIRGHRYEA